MLTHFNKSYYRYKIVATFSVVTILLVSAISKISYDFIYKLYLDQLTENVEQTTTLTISNINDEYENALKSGILTNSTEQFFLEYFDNENLSEIFSELFIFDKNFRIVVHPKQSRITGMSEPRLLLSENEILSLENDNSVVTLPFKGNDNRWYLWCFHKFSDEYWLASRASATRFEKIDELAKIIWIFGLLGLAVVVVVGFVVASSISKPINKLVKFSTGIGKGEFNNGIPVNMKGELKILSDALVLMRENIANNQKEKEKILAQIAHEIRNPLGGIELLTNLVHETLSSENKNKEYTRTILDEISGLKELITSYLNYSKPSIAEPEETDIKEVIGETLNLVRDKLEEKKISVSQEYKIEKIYFDKIHFRNVMLNLLTNSIESVYEKGEIIISSENRNSMNLVTVSDNGSGILDEDIDKVFEPFFTTKSNGTGLGLASCKKYCEDNSAQLVLNNSEHGCSFSIIIENIHE